MTVTKRSAITLLNGKVYAEYRIPEVESDTLGVYSPGSDSLNELEANAVGVFGL